MRRVVSLLAVAACGGGGAGVPPPPDVPAASDEMPGAARYAACREFDGAASFAPVHVVGMLSGADVQSPTCAIINAPFGIESAGPDSVIRLDGLVPGTPYIVQLSSPSDLGFYVASGCSTPSGPAAFECALFVDASSGTQEVGRFIAEAESAHIIVDYYASATPADQSFALDVYAEACTANEQCSAGLPVCSHGRCVGCMSSFDCTNPSFPVCDVVASSCVAGADQCTVDDRVEPGDDGPLGAVPITLGGSGEATATGNICSSPRTEADFFAFQVDSVGETWEFTLGWSSSARLLRLTIYDSTGNELGRSNWEQPERATLTYLASGTYYVKVSEYGQLATPVGYTLSVQRTRGPGCASRADCAREYRNQVFRGNCEAGACIAIDGAATLVEGSECDSTSDCASGLSCASFVFVADPDTRDVCARYCANDAGCAPLGPGYVCSTYLTVGNFCVQKCTSDAQCPVTSAPPPPGEPWDRLFCQLSTGRCL